MPLPVMSQANPRRGAMFLSVGFLKMSPPTVVLAACKSGMLAMRPSSSFGVVTNSYLAPRFRVTLRRADQSSCTYRPIRFCRHRRAVVDPGA